MTEDGRSTKAARGYLSRDDLLAENKRLKGELAAEQTRHAGTRDLLAQAQGTLQGCEEENAGLKEAHEGYDGQLAELEESLRLSDQVRIGCPENHPFKPSGGLTAGHVRIEGDGSVTVWCSRGHFDMWHR